MEKEVKHGDYPFFYMWLPRGVGKGVDVDACYRYFDSAFLGVEDIVFEYFGLPREITFDRELLPASDISAWMEEEREDPMEI